MKYAAGISRRFFLALAGAAIATPPLLFAKEENMVPSTLDHILLGTYDLQHGIDFVEKRTGVHAAFGGVHPGRGTQNALLSLGERRYLEIIAPDPAQPHVKNPLAKGLRSLEGNALIGWAAHVKDISAFANTLRAAGIELCGGPAPGSRSRPDGRVLEWKTLHLVDTQLGILPFFIEWAPDTIHPSNDAPTGCSLVRFTAVTDDSQRTRATLRAFNLDLFVERGSAAQATLQCVIQGPKGKLEIQSSRSPS
jgi:Glyoxalase-like domain